jgi:predicted NBD/HSP70 family sugar kinase
MAGTTVQSAQLAPTKVAEAGSKLLSYIARNPGTNRADLALTSGLSRTTVAKRLDELIAMGLVRETIGVSIGGRPPLELTLNPESGVLLAADIGATHCTIEVSDLDGTVLAQESYSIAISDGPTLVLQQIDDRFRALLDGLGRAASAVLAIGIGVPGPVEHLTGTVVRPPIMPGWDGYRVPDFFSERYGAPTLVDNDVNLAALGEYWVRNESAEHLLYVKISTGIGCGIVSGGVLHRGAEGAAGDIGHIRVPGASESICACGNIGCLEAVAGGEAIARSLRELGLSDVHTAKDVATRALEGNRLARRAVIDASEKIGQVLASLVSFYNPNAIVIGGPLAELNEELLAGIRTAIYQRALPLATRALRVERSTHSDAVGALGARAMALDFILSPSGVQQLISR